MPGFTLIDNAQKDISIILNDSVNAPVKRNSSVASASNKNSYTINQQAPKQQGQQTFKNDSVYGEIVAQPVMDAVDGIKFDFNNGIRIFVPKTPGKVYHVTFLDMDTGIILYSADIPDGGLITSVKKFYVRFKLIINLKDDPKPLFEHEYDCRDKEVMIQMPVGTLGDSIGWFSYVERFQLEHHCKLTCVMTDWIRAVFEKQYPNITFINKQDTIKHKPYATYYLGLFFRGNVDNQPVDFRYIGLHRTIGYILGLKDKSDIAPRVDLSAPRKIKEKYVVIAAQSSSQAKYWNNPFGWINVVKFLKDNGYRVLCIDKEKVHGCKLNWNFIPYGVEDFTGDKPLQERVDLIKDADFFIGLSSGLSWLAWCCKVPIVMISGFTHPTNEFYTPYRVINYHTCHSCWNDMRENFDHFDFLWCPRHKGDDRQFECTKLISAQQVIDMIKTIPTFKPEQDKNLENVATETVEMKDEKPVLNDQKKAEGVVLVDESSMDGHVIDVKAEQYKTVIGAVNKQPEKKVLNEQKTNLSIDENVLLSSLNIVI